MNKNTVKEEVLWTTKPGHVVVVQVYYDLGGACMFNGVHKPRGYYLSVGPEQRKRYQSGGTARSFGMFSAPTVLLLPAARKSPKAGGEAVRLSAAKRAELLARVLSSSGLELVPEGQEPPAVPMEAF